MGTELRLAIEYQKLKNAVEAILKHCPFNPDWGLVKTILAEITALESKEETP